MRAAITSPISFSMGDLIAALNIDVDGASLAESTEQRCPLGEGQGIGKALDDLGDDGHQLAGGLRLLGSRAHEYALGKRDEEVLLDARLFLAGHIRRDARRNYVAHLLLDVIDVDAGRRNDEREHQIAVAFR